MREKKCITNCSNEKAQLQKVKIIEN